MLLHALELKSHERRTRVGLENAERLGLLPMARVKLLRGLLIETRGECWALHRYEMAYRGD
jgi:hypothetical protein